MGTSTDAPLSIDLEQAPEVDAQAILRGGQTHFWAGASQRPLPVQVRLPGQLVYEADAALVAATSVGLDGFPNHVAVILDGDVPTADLVRKHAAAWGVDGAELAAWEQHAQRAGAAGDRAHTTHVLGPVTAGSVKLELEIAHHLPENASVASALFSW